MVSQIQSKEVQTVAHYLLDFKSLLPVSSISACSSLGCLALGRGSRHISHVNISHGVVMGIESEGEVKASGVGARDGCIRRGGGLVIRHTSEDSGCYWSGMLWRPSRLCGVVRLDSRFSMVVAWSCGWRAGTMSSNSLIRFCQVPGASPPQLLEETLKPRKRNTMNAMTPSLGHATCMLQK